MPILGMSNLKKIWPSLLGPLNFVVVFRKIPTVKRESLWTYEVLSRLKMKLRNSFAGFYPFQIEFVF